MSKLKKKNSKKTFFYLALSTTAILASLPLVVSCSSQDSDSSILDSIVKDINNKKVNLVIDTSEQKINLKDIFSLKKSLSNEKEIKEHRSIEYKIQVEFPKFNNSSDLMFHIIIKSNLGPNFEKRTINKKASEINIVNKQAKKLNIDPNWIDNATNKEIENKEAYLSVFKVLIDNKTNEFQTYFSKNELHIIDVDSNNFLRADKINEKVFNNMQPNISAEPNGINIIIPGSNQARIIFKIGQIKYSPEQLFTFSKIIDAKGGVF